MSRPSERDAGDPIALRSPLQCRFYAAIMARHMRGAFRAVRLAEPGLPRLPHDRPLMVYANHPSWWDPAFFMVLSTSLFPEHQPYGPIDTVMLDRYRFMRRIGVFGVSQNSARGGIEFLRTATRILERPHRMLWITAQGEFADPRLRPVVLRDGAARLMRRVPGLVALPLAVEYPFWTEKRPEALALFGEPITVDGVGAERDPEARLARSLEAAMDDLAGRAMRQDATLFRRLLDGSAGVGGVYGAWSRLRAAISGRRHVADHMEET